ncbi:hypothetical protein PNEG_02641 [Pneumocystis murina B123]|uniref:Prenyltransferase alpha-alpha toroid domain-containing protein n=1 Tax=Pneumocystis murina (strain B123) TaxID=1069680 RepID=M7PEG7_PNEMU|nr:hypothetical protein PNEG_02641 [Pneumocystis murina B123]EMR08854.1 hypothetical protein PNEG_02641 [Pneumocystis murina B123]
MSLDIDKHTKFHLRHLKMLPHDYLFSDTSRMSICFFCICSLDLLGSLETSTTSLQRKNWIDWIYSCQVSNGFRDWPTTESFQPSCHDLVHIVSTYFAICILLILKDDMKRLNKKNIIQLIVHLQNKDGSFRPCLGSDKNIQRLEKTDIRFTYCSIATLYILGCKNIDKFIHIESLLKYIESCKSYDHGFSENPKKESHAGYTYCAIASLSLLKNMSPFINKKLSSLCLEKTINWLLKKQLSNIDDYGGFSGRTNKSSDTCYSFWVGAALKCLQGDTDLISEESCKGFLLNRTHSIGGFIKSEGEHPDVMHSYFGLAALSIFGEKNVQEIEPALGISKSSLQGLKILNENLFF